MEPNFLPRQSVISAHCILQLRPKSMWVISYWMHHGYKDMNSIQKWKLTMVASDLGEISEHDWKLTTGFLSGVTFRLNLFGTWNYTIILTLLNRFSPVYHVPQMKFSLPYLSLLYSPSPWGQDNLYFWTAHLLFFFRKPTAASNYRSSA